MGLMKILWGDRSRVLSAVGAGSDDAPRSAVEGVAAVGGAGGDRGGESSPSMRHGGGERGGESNILLSTGTYRASGGTEIPALARGLTRGTCWLYRSCARQVRRGGGGGGDGGGVDYCEDVWKQT